MSVAAVLAVLLVADPVLRVTVVSDFNTYPLAELPAVTRQVKSAVLEDPQLVGDLAVMSGRSAEFPTSYYKMKPDSRGFANGPRFDFAMAADARPDLVTTARMPDGQAMLFFTPYLQDAERTPAEVRANPSYAHLESMIAEADSICRQRQLRLRIVLFPSKADIYGWATRGREPWSYAAATSGVAIALEATSLAKAVAFHDATPFMRARAEQSYRAGRGYLYLHDDTHWSFAGHQAALASLWRCASLPAVGFLRRWRRREGRRPGECAAMTRTAPAVSVVVPTHDRPGELAACLESLSRLDHAAFEVIVVDDGSSSPMEPVVAPFADRLEVRVVRQANAGPAQARNAGAAAARGRFLAFTDDDCRPARDWLTALMRPLEQAPDALVGGSCANALRGSACAQASQDIVSFLYAEAQAHADRFEFFTSNNLACCKDRFLAMGGFDSSFPLAAGEDRELGIRWRRKGGALVYAKDAAVAHHHRLDLARFWRQQCNYGRGALRLRRRLTQRGEPGVPFAGTRFYLGLLTFPYRSGGRKCFQRSCLMLLSQMAILTGFVSEAMEGAAP